jgi:hypothetical protein
VSIIVLQKDETDQRKIIFAINQAIQWINTKGGSGGGGSASGDGAGLRLTLVSGNPVMSNIANPGVSSSIIYYTPYKGSAVPVWNGSAWGAADTGGELAQALSDASKSPSAAALDTLYDMFVWADGSTMRCTRGDAWASQTARASPLGINTGVLVNATGISNGPSAGTGVYVGTIKTGVAAVSCAFHPPQVGPDADGVSFGEIDIWNFYNRINFAGSVQINSPLTNWTWPNTSWRIAGGFGAYIFYYVCGIDEDFINARYDTQVNTFDPSDIAYVGIGVNSFSTPSGVQTGMGSGSATDAPFGPVMAIYAGNPGIGFHYLAALERTSTGSGNMVFYGGDNGGLTVNWKF